MATGPSGIDEDSVRALARVAGIPVREGEAAAITGVLAAWIPDANELSRKMSRPEHWTVTPATVFTQPLADTEEE
jgi:hypothetical protein